MQAFFVLRLQGLGAVSDRAEQDGIVGVHGADLTGGDAGDLTLLFRVDIDGKNGLGPVGGQGVAGIGHGVIDIARFTGREQQVIPFAGNQRRHLPCFQINRLDAGGGFDDHDIALRRIDMAVEIHALRAYHPRCG